jgi:glutamate dehydrogenase/leucine dehydrogenase
MSSLAQLSPRAFADHLRALGLDRAYVVTGADGRLHLSDPALAELQEHLQGSPDYHRHEGIFIEVGPETGALFGAFVHDTRRGQGQGGLRYWPYPTLAAFLSDGLRLAQGMTRKNALAGLWWGGAKGIIARDPAHRADDPGHRAALYREYAAFVTSLGGCYITAEDAGTGPSDMAQVFSATRFVTCIPPAFGGSGNPSPATARGVVCAMEGALDHRGEGPLAGKRIVMQGTGNVAAAMIGELLDRGVAHVLASEIDPNRRAELLARFAGAPLEIRLSPPGDASILAEPCDILAPNALGGILSPATIPTIQAPIICGAANNQLLDERRDADALRARGILYVPDFLANRMGIVSCANEQYGVVRGDPAIQRHLGRTWENSVYLTTRRTLELAEREGITTAAAAIHLADQLAAEPHPIWGHRGRAIIDTLVDQRWHRAR